MTSSLATTARATKLPITIRGAAGTIPREAAGLIADLLLGAVDRDLTDDPNQEAATVPIPPRRRAKPRTVGA
ncbi:MAG: hypothetical protein ACYC35_22885 [Pirellulales bacterium]